MNSDERTARRAHDTRPPTYQPNGKHVDARHQHQRRLPEMLKQIVESNYLTEAVLADPHDKYLKMAYQQLREAFKLSKNSVSSGSVPVIPSAAAAPADTREDSVDQWCCGARMQARYFHDGRSSRTVGGKGNRKYTEYTCKKCRKQYTQCLQQRKKKNQYCVKLLLWERNPRDGYPSGEWSLKCPDCYPSDKRCWWTRCDGECKKLFLRKRGGSGSGSIRTVENCKTCRASNSNSVFSAGHQATTYSASSPASRVRHPTNDHTGHASNSANNQLTAALRLPLQSGRSASRSDAVDGEKPEQMQLRKWACRACTLINKATACACDACGTPRGYVGGR